METLSANSGQPEAVPQWGVREGLLSTGGQAAFQLGRWQDALDPSFAHGVVGEVPG